MIRDREGMTGAIEQRVGVTAVNVHVLTLSPGRDTHKHLSRFTSV